MEKNNLAEQAYVTLRDSIQQFRLAPGTVISDYYLSQELEMSRTPIRQALVRLEQDGLVEIGSNNKMMVSRLSITDIREIYEAREAIECKAGQMLIENGGLQEAQKQELLELHKMLIQSVEQKNLKGNFSADSQFHLRIMEYAGNERLIWFFNRLSTQSMRARYLSAMVPEWFSKTISDHEAILNALLSKNKEQFSISINAHLDDSIENYGKILNDLPSYAMMNVSVFRQD